MKYMMVKDKRAVPVARRARPSAQAIGPVQHAQRTEIHNILRSSTVSPCSSGLPWQSGKAIAPKFNLVKIIEPRSDSKKDTSYFYPRVGKFRGYPAVDCGKKVWRYQPDSIEVKGIIHLVYFFPKHYPVGSIINDNAPLVNVNKANWKGIINDLRKNKDGMPKFWHSYQAENDHEEHHWNFFKGQVTSQLKTAEKNISMLEIGFDKVKTERMAREKLEFRASKILFHCMRKAMKAHKKAPDKPGDPPYMAQVPAIERLIKRVNAHAKMKGF